MKWLPRVLSDEQSPDHFLPSPHTIHNCVKGRIYLVCIMIPPPSLITVLKRQLPLERNRLHGRGDQHDHSGFETQFLCEGN